MPHIYIPEVFISQDEYDMICLLYTSDAADE